jgi:hypothetical protein
MKGKPVYVEEPAGSGNWCFCICSCLAHNTPVAISAGQWKAIQEIKTGESVLTLREDKTWVEAKVVYSDGTPPSLNGNRPMIYLRFNRQGADVELLVTEEHPFLLPNMELQTAEKLAVGMHVLDDNMKPAEIIAFARGRYKGGIHNVSTVSPYEGGDNADIWGHLINTSGIISGDMYAQKHLIPDAMLEKPSHGSPAYLKEHPFGGVPFRASITRSGMDLSAFEPYSEKFTPPEGARPYLPDWMSTAKPGMLKSLSDPVPLEIAEYLVAHFKRFYPEPEHQYHIEWADNTVNAYAWVQGGRRHVALLGGLIRHTAMYTEGIGLVLAHELAHHHGRPNPNHPDGLSCEGEADYFGANIVMRNVWWGPEFVEQMIKGTDQLYDLLKNGLVSSLAPEIEARLFAAAGCEHPPADCRKETYLAALRGTPKPECAGPPSSIRIRLAGAVPVEVTITTDLPYGALTVDDCPPALCADMGQWLRGICAMQGMHNKPVYVSKPDGGWCRCYCR